MNFLSNLGRLFQIPSVLSCRAFHKVIAHTHVAYRRQNIYEKAIEECRRAGETMRQITEKASTRASHYPDAFISEEIHWLQKFMIPGYDSLIWTAKDSGQKGPIEDKCRKSKCKIGDNESTLYYGPTSKDQGRCLDDDVCGCYKEIADCKKSNGPCGNKNKEKKQNPCGKKKDKKENPCGKKDSGKKKKEDSCGKKKGGDPCGKKKKEDNPCGKKKEGDPCGKKKKGGDPCGKKKTDPCAPKGGDTCGKKKPDLCGKKKEEKPATCKKEVPKKKLVTCKKEEPKKKDDKCKKKNSDPCGKGGKKESPCKKKDSDPCGKGKKKEDPCSKKKKCSGLEDALEPKQTLTWLEWSKSHPFMKPKKGDAVIKRLKSGQTQEQPCEEIETKDVFLEVDVVDGDKQKAVEDMSSTYKNKEYFTYSNTAFYDLEVFMAEKRSNQCKDLEDES